jgi:hypothetical protein
MNIHLKHWQNNKIVTQEIQLLSILISVFFRVFRKRGPNGSVDETDLQVTPNVLGGVMTEPMPI